MRKYALLLLVLIGTLSGMAIGWPAGHKGVMLQGFYWDSYADTKWTNLESQSDELSEYFNLIWVPNSAYAGGGNTMGYMPIYWFTRHNSSFGTEAQLQSMISTFRQKGVGVIADVVVNHRNGASNWTNFPAEEWNGRTWQLGPEHICSTDEVAGQAGQARPTGAPDTGEDFNGARDLDHTNAVVQDNVKNYCKCLLEKYGYVGFRLDMVKGYAGRFTKIYNQYSRPTYCVGEYWDGQYDAVAAWIEATGRESAAFDFPGKYAINEAFASNDMTKLVWYANGTTPQPAGLIHYGYPQLAVTFIDNHDTYRDGSKFTGNVPAAYAFLMASPGTPCVLLAHWKTYKTALKNMIAARNLAGVTNTSTVTVLKTSRDCYMAVIQGTDAKMAVRIGSTSDVPSGFSSADVKASGNGYCIWVNKQGTGPVIDPDPENDITVYFDNSVTNWSKVLVHYWGTQESTWPGVDMTKVENNIYKYTLPAGTIGVVFNNGSGSQTADVTGLQNNHVYKPTSASGKPECTDTGVYGGGGGGGGDEGDFTRPAELYVLGNLKDASWVTNAGFKMTPNTDGFTADVEFVAAAGETSCFFNLTDALGADWDELNATANRYGSQTEGEQLTLGTPAQMRLYANGVDASGCLSWKVPAGKYTIKALFPSGKIVVTNSSGLEVINYDQDAPAVYYNLQGIQVDNPRGGVFIERRGNTARRVLIP